MANALDIVTNLLTGGVAGGLLGIAGNITSTLLAMKQKQQEQDYNLRLIPLQLNADVERAKAQVAVATEQGASAAFNSSINADVLTGRESVWVVNLKALTRPFILTYLTTLTGLLYFFGKLSDAQQTFIVENIVIATVTATSWYFGSRATANVMQGFKTKA